MRKVFGCIAFLSFLYVLGTVGAIEQNMADLGGGTIRGAIGIAVMWVTTWLAGGFDPYEPQKKSRPRCSRPQDCKPQKLNPIVPQQF